MFKKSRNKIVVAIMSILILLWVGTLGVIYSTTYFSVSERNYNMLESHANSQLMTFDDKEFYHDGRGPKGDRHPFDDNPAFILSTFYTVTLNDQEQVIEISNAQPSLHSDEELQQLALNIHLSKQTKGKTDTLLYYSESTDEHSIVAFMDNTIFQDSISTLFKYTLIYGALAIFLFFFLAHYLADKIIKPLEDSYEKQKRFISDASHELKTPISVINTNAEMLYRETGPNKWLSNIQYENKQMTNLIEQLLELTRSESVLPKMEVLDFSHLINGEVLPFESLAFEKGLRFNFDIDESIKVKGNGSSLCQLVSTLIENALSYGTPKTTVDITLKKDHKFAYFSVTNSGEEIPPEHIPNIFDRFYRVDSSRHKQGHYGLGLAIAKAITVSHKGTIEVECRDGKIQFLVKLPVLH